MENVNSKREYIQSAKWFRNFVSKNDSKMFKPVTSNVSKAQTLPRSKSQKCTRNDLYLNFNCHANSTDHAPCSAQNGCMIIPDQKDRFLVTKQNHINYTKELLQQIEEVKEKKIKERELEKEQEQLPSDDTVNGTRLCECSDALLTDIYGHVLVRRNKCMTKHDNIFTDACLNMDGTYPEELQVSSENFMNCLKKNLSAHSHQAIQENLLKQQNTTQLTIPTSCLVSNFRRGGHGIFGEPITDIEKQKRLKYQQELLEQINNKREKEKLEREAKIKEDKEMKKKLEEYMQRQKEKEKEEQKKIEEEIKDQNHTALLNYKNELLNQIKMKKENEIEAKKRSIVEDLELLKQNKERESHTICTNVPEGDLRRKKFDNELSRKPRQSVEEYQQELLQQIREKRAAEALQRQAEEAEERELLKINEEKIARLIIENQLIQPKLKHFDAKQQIKEQIEVNKKYQEFLLKQMKQREAQLMVDKSRELEEETKKQEEEIKFKIMKFCSGDYAPEPQERSSTRCCSEADQRAPSSATLDGRSSHQETSETEGRLIINGEINENKPKEKARRKAKRNKATEGCGDVKNDDDEFYELFKKAQQEQKIMYSKDLLQQIENKKKESDKEKENDRIEEEKMRKINRDRERRRIMGERRNRKKLDKITNDQLCLQCVNNCQKSPPVAPVRKSVQKKFWKNLLKNCKGKFENGFYLQEKNSNNCQNTPGFWSLFNRASSQRLTNKNSPAENVQKCTATDEKIS